MGYYSTCKGQIEITPPLCHWELKALPDLEPPHGAEIELVIQELLIEEDTGTLVTRFARTVRPMAGEEDWKRYHTADQLKVLVAAFPCHKFTGYFEFLGEDGDRWRTVVKNSQVTDDVKPELRWPE